MTKKEQILKTALKLFIENGFEKTPTSLISKEANVATGTLFHHFKTKEDLINTLYLETKLEVMETMSAVVKETEGLQSKVQVLWFNFISWVLEHQNEYRFLVQFGESSLISNNTREHVEAAFQESKAFLKDGLTDGTFYQLPLELLMKLLTSHIFTSCNYFIENPTHWDNVAFRERVFASCWSVLAEKV